MVCFCLRAGLSCLRLAGFLFALLIALPVYLFLLAVFPKSLFRRLPFRALVPLAGLLEFVFIILSPALEFGSLIGATFIPSRNEGRARLFAAREELKLMAAQSEREGSLTSPERAMIYNVVDFRMVKAQRRDGSIEDHRQSSEPDMSAGDVLKLTRASGIDRLPVVTPEESAWVGECVSIFCWMRMGLGH